MSKKRSAVLAGASAAQAVEAVKTSPLIQRVVTDEDLHDNVRVAYASARQAYDRVASSKKSTQTVLNDKKLHAEVAAAAAALRDVGNALSQPKKVKKKRSGGLVRKLLVLVVGAGAAVAISADLRNKLLDLLFGAEEEFDYTSTTAPATPPPPPPAPEATTPVPPPPAPPTTPPVV
jgi:hypothetical protein